MRPGSPAVNSWMETWTVVDDGFHNAFTDLIQWRNAFWLAYVSSPSHFASRRSRVVILRSPDARAWKEVARFDGSGEDLRDPKLGVVRDRLVLYALLNRKVDPESYQTVTAYTRDGESWSSIERLDLEGWLLGRPVTADSAVWYAPAHHIGLGTAALLASRDGTAWVIHSIIQAGDHADETAVLVLQDGRMLAVTRIEAGGGLFGHAQAGTLISHASPPYRTWSALTTCRDVRLDGPLLIRRGSQVFAVGRRQVDTAGPFRWPGSVLARKRCSLFRVREAGPGLIHLVDLPSSGDTAYAGAVLAEDALYVSYYTSPPDRDPPWLIGLLRSTRIQMARIRLSEARLIEAAT